MILQLLDKPWVTDVLHEAMSSCHDRIITGLDLAEQVLWIEKAERAGEKQLYALGFSLLKLEVVY